MGRGPHISCEGCSTLELVPAGAPLQGALLSHEARLQTIRKHDLHHMGGFAMTASNF